PLPPQAPRRPATVGLPTPMAPLEFTSDGPAIWTVRAAAVDHVAWAAAALAAAGVLVVGRGARGRTAGALVVVALVGYPLLAGPPRPLALGPALVGIAAAALGRLAPKRAAAATAALLAWPGAAAAPEPSVVLIVPGEPQVALVPPALLARLD